MTCYMISQGGEPVALVSNIAMARAIAECQPWGDYLVEQLEMGEPIPARPSRPRGPSIDHQPGRSRRQPGKRSPRWNHGIPAAAIDRARHQTP